MGQSWPFLFIFDLILQFQYKLKKAWMVCLVFEPGAAGWQVQTKPRSYGGHLANYSFCDSKIKQSIGIHGKD